MTIQWFSVFVCFCTNISKSNVAMPLRCDGVFNYCFTRNLLLCLSEFWQVLSSSWDWRPFGHNRHGTRVEKWLLCPFWGDMRRSEAEATAGHKDWRGMDRHSLPNNYLRWYNRWVYGNLNRIKQGTGISATPAQTSSPFAVHECHQDARPGVHLVSPGLL